MREHIQQATDLRDAVVTCFLAGDGGELGCDLDRLYDLIDAALRRAKAEGMREASGAAKKLASGVVPTAAMNALNLLGVELDARAAQIEEGE